MSVEKICQDNCCGKSENWSGPQRIRNLFTMLCAIVENTSGGSGGCCEETNELLAELVAANPVDSGIAWENLVTLESDVSGGYETLVAAPGVGFKLQIRYLSYSLRSNTPDEVIFSAEQLNGTTYLYAAYSVQGTIWATRFNKQDYLELPEDHALVIESNYGTATAVNSTVEYRIIPV